MAAALHEAHMCVIDHFVQAPAALRVLLGCMRATGELQPGELLAYFPFDGDALDYAPGVDDSNGYVFSGCSCGSGGARRRPVSSLMAVAAGVL